MNLNCNDDKHNSIAGLLAKVKVSECLITTHGVSTYHHGQVMSSQLHFVASNTGWPLY